MATSRRRATTSLTVRFARADADAIRQTAQRLDLTYSALVRAAVGRATTSVEQPGVIVWPPPRTATGR